MTINSNLPYDRTNTIYNYHIILSSLYYKLGVKFKIKPSVFIGAFKNPITYGPYIGAQILYPFKNGFILIRNQHQYATNYTTNLIAVAEFRPQLNDKIHLYSRAQFFSESNFEIFTRNIQILRLGLGFNKLDFGLAATFDQFQNQTISFQNYGMFLRTKI